MPVHSRRYFQMVERKSSDVNPLWKVLHALTFIVIVMMSLTAAFGFHAIFDSFSYNCVLYAKPVVHFSNVTYHSVPDSPTNDSNITDTVSNNTGTVSNNTSGMKRQVDTSSNASDLIIPFFDITTTAPDTTTALDTTTTMDAVNTTASDEEATITNGSSLQIINNEYWIRNSTLDAKLQVNLRETIFGSNEVCNTVLFFPLFALVFATFAAIIVMICGRGGKGYMTELFPQQWIYLYPFLILSLVMAIINAVALSYLHIGMERFCLELKEYTGISECSKKINYFTDKTGFGDSDFYETYNRCLISLFIELILWLVQMLLIIMRIICMADFQLNIVKVSCRRRHSLEYDVHEYLTKNHALKKVTFEEKKSPKDDEEKVTQV